MAVYIMAAYTTVILIQLGNSVLRYFTIDSGDKHSFGTYFTSISNLLSLDSLYSHTFSYGLISLTSIGEALWFGFGFGFELELRFVGVFAF